MAESWAKIRNEYGDTAYTAKDFMAEHAVMAGGKTGRNSFNQPITNFKLNLDRTIPIITIKEKYKGMNWRDLRDNQLPNKVEEKILSPRNEKNEYIPYVNKRTGRKVIITKGSISHFKSDHTRDKESQKERRTTLHYEVIEAIPQVLETGIWIEQHQDYHGAAKMVHRVVGAVKIGEKVFGVRILVKKEKNKYKVEKGEYTQYRASDLTIKNEPALGGTSGNNSQKGEVDRPSPNTDSFEISIRDLLKHVNDNLKQPYINPDGTPNYGIYFGDHETGGVMFITPKDSTTFNQRAWHGSGMDFNEFNLEKALTGAGDMVHVWSIYTTKNKKTARAYKKHAKSKGLPSYQYEVDIPFIDVRPCV